MTSDEARIEAAVQKRLAAAMAAQQQQFAEMMQSAMQSALGGVDQASDALAGERKKLEGEIDAARALRQEAERKGEQWADEAYEARRQEYSETAKYWVLHQLARKHFEGGQTARDIAKWLDVDLDFIEKVRESAGLSRGGTKLKTVLAGNPRVSFADAGRSGEVIFESDEARFALWWEMGGGEALAIVEAPTAEAWEVRTGLPAERRETVLNFIGEAIVERQTHAGWFVLGVNTMTIFSK